MIYFLLIVLKEFLPGQILKELTQNNRIVGGINTEDTKVAKKISMQGLVDGEILTTTARVAEMSKLVEIVFVMCEYSFCKMRYQCWLKIMR